MSDCEARGGCVYVKVRPDEDVMVCKNCGATKPESDNLVGGGSGGGGKT